MDERPVGQAAAESSVGANFALMLGGDLANKSLRFVATTILARSLALDDFGLVNVGIAISGVVVMVTTLGLPDLGSRQVAVSRHNASELAHAVVGGRLLACLPLLAIALAGGYLLARDSFGLIAAAAAMTLFMTVSVDWLARGLERMAALSIAWIAGGGTVLVCAALVAAGPQTAPAALAAFAAGEAAIALVSWLAVRKRAQPGIRLRGLRTLLSQSWPLWLSSVIVYGYYANLDTIILGITRSPEEAGLYSGAYRVFLVLNVVGLFAAYAAQPSLSRKAAAGEDRAATESLLGMLEALAGYGMLVVGIVEVAGGNILALLFGTRFESAGPTFVLLSVGLAWYSVGFPAGYSLLAKGQQRRLLAGAATAGVVGLVLDLVLIPPLGLPGAGTATAASFAAATVVWLNGRGLLLARMVPILAALSLVSAGAVIVALELAPGPLIGAATIAGVATTGMLYALRRLRR